MKFFNSHHVDEMYDTVVLLIRDSVSHAKHGNVNRVWLNDMKISTCLRRILRSYKHLNNDSSLHVLRGSLEQLVHVKGGLNEYSNFFENNISVLNSEHVVRSATDGYLNEFVSAQYSIIGMCKTIVDSRIRICESKHGQLI